jgi:hypothetical protein
MDSGYDSESSSSFSSISSFGSDSSMSPEVSALSPGYHPTCDAVFRVRFYFLQFLPLELVDVIICHAQYYPRIHSHRSQPLVAAASNFSQPANNARWCYLITPPIPNNLDGSRTDTRLMESLKVRKVRFWVKGCDQGWGGELHDRGEFVPS